MSTDTPIISIIEGPIPHTLGDVGPTYYYAEVFVYSCLNFWQSRKSGGSTSWFTTRLQIFNSPEFIIELDEGFMTKH